MDDALGYDRLIRSLDFLIVETEAAGVDGGGLRAARGFFGGSPTEFLGETLLAIEALLPDRDALAPSVTVFAETLADEIRQGFEQIGGA